MESLDVWSAFASVNRPQEMTMLASRHLFMKDIEILSMFSSSSGKKFLPL